MPENNLHVDFAECVERVLQERLARGELLLVLIVR